jgi:hypothetical protein
VRVLAAALCAAALLAPAPAHAASLTTIAGTGVAADAGDGGPATSASLNAPYGIAAMPGGGYVVSEIKGHRIRRVAPDGTISTLAGNVQGFGGDGGPATAASLSSPFGVAAQADGGVLIADFGNQRIRRVAPDGTISTVAGNGHAGYAGDGGPATEAALAWPNAVAALPGGGFLISDWLNQRIRRVDADGRISTVAGTGTAGFAGDGGPATLALLNSPLGLAATPDGGFLIADHDNDRIRRVSPDGVITTLAGSGVRGFSGDGGPATAAAFNRPTAVVADGEGGVLVADRTNQRIRRVAPDGTIATVAGSGVPAWLDAGDATQGQLREPSGVAALGGGVALIADTDNHRVRRLQPADPGSPPPPGTAVGVIDLAARAAPLEAHGGRLVWSRFDPASGRFALVTRVRTAVRRLSVRTRKVPFDVDVGRGPGGRPWAVYSRCRREPVTSVARMGLPVWATGRGCDLYAFDLARKRERRLRLPGSRRASEFLPSVAGGRIAYGRVTERRGRRGRPKVVVRRLDGRGAVVRWTRPRSRQGGPTGLDLARRALAIGWASSSPGGRPATQVWLRAGGRSRRLDDASVGSGRWLTAPVLDGSWLVWGESCASGTVCRAPRLRRAALRSGRRGTATPPALALAAIAFDRGHAFALVGAGPTAAESCGSAITGASCRVLDLGRPFR